MCFLVHKKEPLLLVAVGFLCHYLNEILPYIRCTITIIIKNVLIASLNKNFFPSFTNNNYLKIVQIFDKATTSKKPSVTTEIQYKHLNILLKYKILSGSYFI